jgi:cytochrome oxidase Cu insertion factor (SCO1/SenC/PrrC family)/thiol-disulfide isomerase/thioredoxin
MPRTPDAEQPMKDPPRGPPTSRGPRWTAAALVVGLAAILAAAAAVASSGSRSSPPASSLANNPSLDPGTPLNRPAPDFTLTDQFGRRISLSSFRGQVVVLSFNDSECTTICPLTTTAMLDAKRSLGAAGSRVQLLGVDANPRAISTRDVLSYSDLHGMVRQWHFLTGSLAQLRAVWRAYGIGVDIERGQIDHTPALFVIDSGGRLRRVYLTQSSYAAVPQLGQLIAREVSRLLPRAPQVYTNLSYARIRGVSPAQPFALRRLGGGTVRLGSGAPHLYLFFATWDREVTNLAAQLERLNRWAATARAAHLPALTAIDEASVEPGPGAPAAFVHGLARPLSYPVALDVTGRVADGYEVQDEPWLVLADSSGRIVWYRDVSTSGWPSIPALVSEVRAGLARAPRAPGSPAAARQQLAGSPPPLAALHAQSSQLLGSAQALDARVRSLRGYPIVVNVWASWCAPCQAEFGLLANASARYGRQVAFLGADVNDSSGDAQAFLRQHPVSYPSYQLPQTGIQSLLPQGVIGLPTTFYVSAGGKVVYVHTGQYESQGTLDQDIQNYAH